MMDTAPPNRDQGWNSSPIPFYRLNLSSMLKIPSQMSKVAGNESVPEQIDDDRRSSQKQILEKITAASTAVASSRQERNES